jgi:PmbA protein
MSISESEFLAVARPLAERLRDYAMTAGKPFGITDARISIAAEASQENSIEKGAVANSVSGDSWQVGVALYAGDRKLSFSSNSLDAAALEAAMLKNMQVIGLVPPSADQRLLDPEKVYKGIEKDLDLYDRAPPDTAALIAYAREIEQAALAQEGVKTTRAVSISKSDSHSLVLATNGLDQRRSATMYSAGAAVIAEDAGGMQIGGKSSVARHFSDMAKPAALGAEAGQKAAAKLGATLPATGEMPIVLDNDAAEAFFSAVYSAIDGTALHRGTSFMKGKLGQQVMSKGVTLVDDPLLPRGLASRHVDGAGLEEKKVTFVEDGVLKSYNLDLAESRQLGLPPTGRENGPGNARVLPGTLTPAELIADIKEGILIRGFNGGTVDVNNGTHSRQAYGALIRDGVVTDIAVNGFVVSGNLKDMFMNVVLANDTPAQPGTGHRLAAPTTRINGVTIAGK